MPNIGQKNFNVNISEKLSDEFSEHIDSRGYTKYRALEAALRAFLVLPEDVQVKLMSNTTDAKKLLSEAFQEIAIDDSMKTLSTVQRKRLKALVKQVAKQVSQD